MLYVRMIQLKEPIANYTRLEVLQHRDAAKVFNRPESRNDRRVFGLKAHSSLPLACCTWGGVQGHVPREILKMRTRRDPFSLILGAKSRAFIISDT